MAQRAIEFATSNMINGYVCFLPATITGILILDICNDNQTLKM